MSGAIPVAYSIQRGGGLKLEIALVETDRLLLHEETIPEMLEDLARSIERDGVLKAPVVVDRETLVVLDGMHRVKALHLLGCRFTCACLVDYQSPEIEVERWCRTVSKPFDAGEAVEVAAEAGLNLHPRPPSGDQKEALYPVMVFGDACYDVVTPCPGLLSAFKAVRELELRLKERGFDVGYETPREAMEKLEKGAVNAVILPPKIGKEQVVETAKRGRVFTVKATRHIVPARPVGVDVPLSLLRDASLTVDEANRRLSEMLSRKRLIHIPPGRIWEGRRYEEDLYLFEDA